MRIAVAAPVLAAVLALGGAVSAAVSRGRLPGDAEVPRGRARRPPRRGGAGPREAGTRAGGVPLARVRRRRRRLRGGGEDAFPRRPREARRALHADAEGPRVGRRAPPRGDPRSEGALRPRPWARSSRSTRRWRAGTPRPTSSTTSSATASPSPSSSTSRSRRSRSVSRRGRRGAGGSGPRRGSPSGSASAIPAEVSQAVASASADASRYIAEYNLRVHHLLDEKGRRLFPAGKRLLSHWNLRDEIKASYGDAKDGLAKQRTIARAMERIVTQTIPKAAIDSPWVDWNPFTNEVKVDDLPRAGRAAASEGPRRCSRRPSPTRATRSSSRPSAPRASSTRTLPPPRPSSPAASRRTGRSPRRA